MTTDRQPGHGLSTRCVHDGDARDPRGGIHAPLYNHSTFAFASTADLLDVVDGRKEGSLYTRYGLNPTLRAVERKLASLEGAQEAWVFGSGMAAESATFLAHVRPGERIVCLGDVYGGTYELLGKNLPSLGIETVFLLSSELDRLDAALDGARLVFFETPTNPRMEVFDVAAIAAQARRLGALCVVDNTFATPVAQRPLELGADLVIHSATKYLGGHSDLTGGVVLGSQALLGPIHEWRKNLGQVMAPEVAFLLARSLRTLVVRVRAQSQTALGIARRLEDHPRVAQVSYPGLPSSPFHALARRQMQVFGGMLSFDVDGGADAASAVVDRLRLFSIAPSLGGVESLVTQPITTTHRGLLPEERARRGIGDGLIRLSIGLEDEADLWADLARALEG